MQVEGRNYTTFILITPIENCLCLILLKTISVNESITRVIVSYLCITGSTRFQLFYIDNGERLKTKFYDRCDDLTFPVVNFPFISSNSPASPAYWVYVIHNSIIPYSRACAQYSDFLTRAQLLTQRILKQGYVAPRLKASLHWKI